MIFAQGKDFGFEEQTQFGIGLTGIDEMVSDQGFLVSPNPVRDYASVSFDLASKNSVQLRVYNATGTLVFENTKQDLQAGSHSLMFENKDLNAGLYYFQLSTGENLFMQKVIITK